MRRCLFSTFLALALLLAALGGSASAGGYDYLLAPETACPNQTSSSLSVQLQEAAMACLVNYARRQSGLPALVSDPRLTDSADRKARDILYCQQFSHTACGRSFDYHMRAVGYWTGYGSIGENIAWGSGSYGSARRTMSAWLNSSGHRANVLSARFRDQGIGLVKGTFQGYSGAQIWVNQFGYRAG